MQELTQETKQAVISAPANYNSATATTEYINLKGANRVRFTIHTGAWAGGTAAVTFLQAINVSGSSSASLTFSEYFTGTGDTLTRTTAASNTFNLAAANTKYVVEFKASQLTPGLDCLAIAVASPGANNDYYAVMGEAYGLRYANGPSSNTVITD